MLSYILPYTVREAALRRIEWLWNEFEGRVVVSMSGGKDSTVILHLTHEVLQRVAPGRKIPVLWLDQELEYAATCDYMREVMYRDYVEPYWLQVPFRLANNTSHDPEHMWLHVWGPGEEWIRERDPVAITENTFGTDRFKALLHNASEQLFPDHAIITGMRVEESPKRRLALTTYPAYKWATWGRGSVGGKYTHRNMAPLYDWTWRDVWLAIAESDWPYNRHYDAQYQLGTRLSNMRVSNFHHEQSVQNLWTLQQIEPETWARATKRLEGINTAGMLGRADYVIYDLPFMFTSWLEYREHLIDNLLVPEMRASYRHKFATMENAMPATMLDPRGRLRMWRQECRSIVSNDHEFVQLEANLNKRPRHLREADNVMVKERRRLARAGAVFPVPSASNVPTAPAAQEVTA